MDLARETVDWNRCVHIDSQIDDAMLVRLTPLILSLRQKGNAPITVAINSVGGSVAVMDALRGLLTGPNQDGETCPIITVATHRAYSAAALLLSLGDYSVVLPHSEVLFHDVRYSGLGDVTPSVALKAAKQLRTSNEAAALRIANTMFSRWMWNYLDLNAKFTADAERFPNHAAEFIGSVAACNLPASPAFRFDLAGFAISVFARLSLENEPLIIEAMEKLRRWGELVALAGSAPKYTDSDGNPGMLDGARALFARLSELPFSASYGGGQREDELNLLLTLLLSRISRNPTSPTIKSFEEAVNDFSLLSTMDDKRHFSTAARLMLRHKHVFFERETAVGWDALDQPAREHITNVAMPNVKAAWLLCLLVARELFNGEHTLSPSEALCLGLVDEVPGVTGFESRRQLSKLMQADAAKSNPKTPPVRRLKRKGRGVRSADRM